MIMVDVTVPSIGRKYNFSLESQAHVSTLIAEITEVICQHEDCHLEGETGSLVLYSEDKNLILAPDALLGQYGLLNGADLILI